MSSEREELVGRAAGLGEELARALAPFGDHPNVGELPGLGLLRGVELVSDTGTLAPFPSEAHLAMSAVIQGIMRGVFFYPGGSDPARDVVCLGPPFVIGDEEIEKIASVLPEAIDAAARQI